MPFPRDLLIQVLHFYNKKKMLIVEKLTLRAILYATICAEIINLLAVISKSSKMYIKGKSKHTDYTTHTHTLKQH